MAIQVFGQGAVQSSYVSYVLLDISSNDIILVWPDSYQDVPFIDPVSGTVYNTAAKYMSVDTLIDNDFTITLPNATQTSVGQEFIINNIGASPFNLYDAEDNLLLTAIPGTYYYVILIDNTTPEGDWQRFIFGTGTSSADAIELSGYGLFPIANTLNAEVAVHRINTIPTIDNTFRASIIVWQGGIATLTLPLIDSISPGYYVSFTNQGSAEITIQSENPVTPTSPKISGVSSMTVSIGQSLTIISDGANWWTLGFGMNQASAVGRLLKPVGGSTDITLSKSESSNLIQEYNGILTGDIKVFFPIETNNWIITNSTTGDFVLSVQLVGAIGGEYPIPQNTTQSFASDENTIFSTQTSLQTLNSGSLDGPSISFDAPAVTGIYIDPTTLTNGAIKLVTNNRDVASFSNFLGTQSEFDLIYDTSENAFSITATATESNIFYNEALIISISNTGVFSLVQAPLSIGSGGTNAITQPLAAKNILPTAVAGNMLFYNGTDWVVIPPGTIANQTLKWVSTLLPPTWS